MYWLKNDSTFNRNFLCWHFSSFECVAPVRNSSFHYRIPFRKIAVQKQVSEISMHFIVSDSPFLCFFAHFSSTDSSATAKSRPAPPCKQSKAILCLLELLLRRLHHDGAVKELTCPLPCHWTSPAWLGRLDRLSHYRWGQTHPEGPVAGSRCAGLNRLNC